MFGDYKSYKKYSKLYPDWKANHDIAEAKRMEYLRRNPNDVNKDDLQKSAALLRAIDIMDDASQQKAENMEVITEQLIAIGMEITLAVGAVLGIFLSKLKPIKELLAKFNKNGKQPQIVTTMIQILGGGFLTTIAGFPLYAWAAKAEVSASRRGRFEAMRTDLNNSKIFAVLTEEQEKELEESLAKLPQKTKKIPNPIKTLKEKMHSVKEMVFDSPEYLYQKLMFEHKLKTDAELVGTELTEKETNDAKCDQQLLTKLVEKIDIASQDYAENAELATSAVMLTVTGFSTLFAMVYNKIAQKLKIKQNPIPYIVSILGPIGLSICAASIQKEASRVGRFKVKQKLLNNPQQLYYVSDEKVNEITDTEPEKYKKQNIFKFLLTAWKNDREYKKWKKQNGEREKNIIKILENMEMSSEQIKDARRLQHNTFKTFNAVDENSQKYSESIEALGQAAQNPISILFATVGLGIGLKFINKAGKSKLISERTNNILKYIITVFATSIIPPLAINAYITREQKKASRVADMLAINELSDYRKFADYNSVKERLVG